MQFLQLSFAYLVKNTSWIYQFILKRHPSNIPITLEVLWNVVSIYELNRKPLYLDRKLFAYCCTSIFSYYDIVLLNYSSLLQGFDINIWRVHAFKQIIPENLATFICGVYLTSVFAIMDKHKKIILNQHKSNQNGFYFRFNDDGRIRANSF